MNTITIKNNILTITYANTTYETKILTPETLRDSFDSILGIIKIKKSKDGKSEEKMKTITDKNVQNTEEDDHYLLYTKIDERKGNIKFYYQNKYLVKQISKVRYINLKETGDNAFAAQICRFIELNGFYICDDEISDEDFMWNWKMKENMKNYNFRIHKRNNLVNDNNNDNSNLPSSENEWNETWMNASSNTSIEILDPINITKSNNDEDIKTRNIHSEESKIIEETHNKGNDNNKNTSILNNIPYMFCGYFNQIHHPTCILEIISFISRQKIGPRFLCRGIDDHGNVSFFVKTIFTQYKNNDTLKENISGDHDVLYRKILIRGSIPLFWYQDKNPWRKALKFSRENEVSGEPFKKHFDKLKKDYKNIVVLNLLGHLENEKELSDNYKFFLDLYDIKYVNLDLNRYAGNFDILKRILFHELDLINENFQFEDPCLNKDKNDKEIVFRVNCLDCMDRTNVAQYLINEYYFTKNEHDKSILNSIRLLFVENGHALSNFYCGADSLKSELALKGKRSFAGYFDDIMINASRILHGKFADKLKYEIINTILGKNTDDNGETHDESNKENNEIVDTVNVFNGEKSGLYNTRILVLTWCLNFRKCNNSFYENSFFNDFLIDDDVTFFVISLQKIYTSYKKLLFDEKQAEREKWKNFFELKIVNNFILLSQNFTSDLGLLIFTRKEICADIRNIDTQKFRQELFNGNASVVTNFIYKNSKFTFSNSNIHISTDSNNIKLKQHLSVIESDAGYNVMTGYFRSKLYLHNSHLKEFAENMDYEKIALHDYLLNNMELLKGMKEGNIGFLPNGDHSKEDAFPCYYSRIFYGSNLKILEYKDVLYYETGFRPVYGKFYISK